MKFNRMVRVVLPLALAAAALVASAAGLTLAEARGKIASVIANPAAMTAVVRQLSGADQVTYLADVNAAIKALPGSVESQTAKYAGAARAALNGASKENAAAMIAEIFATAEPYALTVINEDLAANVLNRNGDSTRKFSDGAYMTICTNILTNIIARVASVDNAGPRAAFAIMMLDRASGGSPSDVAGELVSLIPDAEQAQLAQSVWLPAALGRDSVGTAESAGTAAGGEAATTGAEGATAAGTGANGGAGAGATGTGAAGTGANGGVGAGATGTGTTAAGTGANGGAGAGATGTGATAAGTGANGGAGAGATGTGATAAGTGANGGAGAGATGTGANVGGFGRDGVAGDSSSAQSYQPILDYIYGTDALRGVEIDYSAIARMSPEMRQVFLLGLFGRTKDDLAKAFTDGFGDISKTGTFDREDNVTPAPRPPVHPVKPEPHPYVGQRLQ